MVTLKIHIRPLVPSHLQVLTTTQVVLPVLGTLTWSLSHLSVSVVTNLASATGVCSLPQLPSRQA